MNFRIYDNVTEKNLEFATSFARDWTRTAPTITVTEIGIKVICG